MSAIHWSTVDRDSALRLLDDWAARGWLRQVDRAFASFIATECPQVDPLLIVAAALASHQLGRGHVCLDLAAALADPRFVLSLPPEVDEQPRPPAGVDEPQVVMPEHFLAGLTLAQWQARLDGLDRQASATPLVLDQHRLYLRRFWRYERRVGAGIADRLRADPNRLRGVARQAGSSAEDVAAIARQALQVLFGDAPAGIDWQRAACALALRSGFSIITGGPGTGKTTTVIRLLALLQALAFRGAFGERAQAQGLRILLAAPTGKAAARLNETIAGAVGRVALDGLPEAERVRAAIPTTVVTLHRLLGSRPDTRRMRHDRSNPLLLDVLVVDEASMIDLEMMDALLQALPPQARLIMLGDKDQLASVEAGAVLGQLCRRAAEGGYADETRRWLIDVAGIDIGESMVTREPRLVDQSIAMLRHSHRFGADSGIGQLARAVNAGDEAQTRVILAKGLPDLALLQTGDPAARAGPRADAVLARLVLDGGEEPARDGDVERVGYGRYLQWLRDGDPGDDASTEAVDHWAAEVLARFGQFQLLCATRRGDDGVERINRRVERVLVHSGLIDASTTWYVGRPVMVTRNDYSLGLMNGDVGVAMACPTRDSTGDPRRRLRVAFASADGKGGIRWVLPSRLQAVETVFAMTVHKAQGSEFEHAALWLPARPSPVLTRELVYTAITRARRWFTLASSESGTDVWHSAVTRRVQRAGALGELAD